MLNIAIDTTVLTILAGSFIMDKGTLDVDFRGLYSRGKLTMNSGTIDVALDGGASFNQP